MMSTYSKRYGHERYRRRKKNNNYAVVARKQGALARLRVQLSKVKRSNEDPENQKAITRMEKEIAILEGKVGKNLDGGKVADVQLPI